MISISVKTGDRFTVGRDTVAQFEHICGGCAQLNIDTPEEVSVVRSTTSELDENAIQAHLHELAKSITSDLSEWGVFHNRDLLGTFVSELFLSIAEQERRELHHQKQAEGIAEAKKRGVQFGAKRRELPDGFEDLAQLWGEGGISAREAARSLGISHNTFLRRAKEYCAAG